MAKYGVPPPGYRLPDSTHVGCVRLHVSNLARSVDYYRRVIGLDVVRRESGRAELGPDGAGVPLLELYEQPGAHPVPPVGHFGLYHFALLVPDRADLGRFVMHLADVDARVASADHLVSEALYLWDPDGLGIEVYADRPRSQWRVNGGQLAMATEPLDLGDLVGAARSSRDGTSWSGLPSGTVVGHMHLRVGTLERAEALFHAALGLDKMVWSFPGALFLAAGGYHHHLGVNVWGEGASPAREDEARLVEWELVLPAVDDVTAAGANVMRAGYDVIKDREDRVVSDDWGTALRLTTRR